MREDFFYEAQAVIMVCRVCVCVCVWWGGGGVGVVNFDLGKGLLLLPGRD